MRETQRGDTPVFEFINQLKLRSVEERVYIPNGGGFSKLQLHEFHSSGFMEAVELLRPIIEAAHNFISYGPVDNILEWTSQAEMRRAILDVNKELTK